MSYDFKAESARMAEKKANAPAPAPTAENYPFYEKSDLFHECVYLLPPNTREEFIALVEDIREHGVLDPVMMYQGKIIDGRHRWQACQILGIECPTIEYKGDPEKIGSFVISRNVIHRHLTPSQKAVLAYKHILPGERDAAARRLEEAHAIANNVRWGKANSSSGIESSRMKASQAAGEAVGVNASTIEAAVRVGRYAPDLLPQIEAGELPISRADKEIKRWKDNLDLRNKAVAGEITWDQAEAELKRRMTKPVVDTRARLSFELGEDLFGKIEQAAKLCESVAKLLGSVKAQQKDLDLINRTFKSLRDAFAKCEENLAEIEIFEAEDVWEMPAELIVDEQL